MTLSPFRGADPRPRPDLPAYLPEAICAHPRCIATPHDRHHIWAKGGGGAGVDTAWFETPNGLIVGNLVGLCRDHHVQVSGDVGGHAAQIVWDDEANLFAWVDLTEKWAEHLDPQPPIHRVPERDEPEEERPFVPPTVTVDPEVEQRLRDLGPGPLSNAPTPEREPPAVVPGLAHLLDPPPQSASATAVERAREAAERASAQAAASMDELEDTTHELESASITVDETEEKPAELALEHIAVEHGLTEEELHQAIETGVCPRCEQEIAPPATRRRQRKKKDELKERGVEPEGDLPPLPKVAKRTWSVAVPVDDRTDEKAASGEDGYSVIEDYLQLFREKRGRDLEESWKYVTLVEALAYATTHYNPAEDEGS